MKTSNCNCHSTNIAVADVCEGALELPRYFPRQLLTPAEMTLEQQYFRTRLRRHNVFMHGWGVVCGAEVCRVPDGVAPVPWKVRVKPGYILGPQGDEILIGQGHQVDLRTPAVAGGSEDPDDVWCTPVFVERDDQVPSELFLAVRYKEVPSRPVRVQPAGCGCDEAQCELSRLQDGYEIGILTECPDSHQNPPTFENLFDGSMPDCPECPIDPWVVLARVELDPDGTIKLVDNCSCRRIAISAANLWWRCTEILTVVPDAIVRGSETTVEITVSRELPSPLELDFGDPEVTAVGTVTATGTLIRVQVFAEAGAALGPHTLTILDSTGNVLAKRESALTILQEEVTRFPETVKPSYVPAPVKPKPSRRTNRAAGK